jgi:hypothetical protein
MEKCDMTSKQQAIKLALQYMREHPSFAVDTPESAIKGFAVWLDVHTEQVTQRGDDETPQSSPSWYDEPCPHCKSGRLKGECADTLREEIARLLEEDRIWEKHSLVEIVNENERLRARLDKFRGLPDHWIALDGEDGEPYDPAYMRRPAVETSAGPFADKLRARIAEMRGALYTYGLFGDSIGGPLLDGVQDAIDELSAEKAVETVAAPIDRQDLRNNLGAFRLEDDPWTDNLAIALCSYFEDHNGRPDPDPPTENGWGQWAEGKADAVLDGLTDAVLKLVAKHRSAEKAVESKACTVEPHHERLIMEGRHYSIQEVRDALNEWVHGGELPAKARAYGPGMTPHADDCECYVCAEAVQRETGHYPTCGVGEGTHREPCDCSTRAAQKTNDPLSAVRWVCDVCRTVNDISVAQCSVGGCVGVRPAFAHPRSSTQLEKP